ncbi:glycine betaine ABC transporter substrate-binding protein [Catellatospora bangladeshensis]|uniref:Glycine/betaine ABC transporter substrate-binding protein n=1 Tax=Catellatospora bangladeshensis TaxID=310355 RepID=A0A8J3NMU2_9ACTN|nr:glycine betaine ABC transporter substrate-binding protein [Catellatospora bangladeshensis]GIF84155.1 glycine/betaine ABC transporter substrate-binding protein [Catellatospora bangladeshensis]
MNHSVDRRRLLLGALGLAAAPVLAACTGDDAEPAAGSSGGAPKQLRIGYQLIPNGDLIVKDLGWLEAALPGTTVVWSKFDSGGDVNTAILAGSLDIGLAGSSPVARGLAAPLNIPYAVPWIFDVIGDNEALVVKQEIADLAGLAGKKIATPFSSTSHYSLLAALAGAGVPDGSVKIIDLEPPEIQAAWQRGDIDGAYVWTPVLAELRKTGKVLVTSRELAGKGKLTADLAVVRTEFLQQYPQVVKAWIQQQDRAVKLVRSDKTAAAQAIGRQLNLDADEAGAQLSELVLLDAAEQAGADYLGTPAAPGKLAENLHNAAQFLVGQGKLPSAPELGVYQKGLAVQALADAAAA